MNLDQFKPLLDEGESQDLEWKRDWPTGLPEGKRDPKWDNGRGELLKDLISLANSAGSSPAHLVYGVKDLGASRKVFGISRLFDDADFQQWAANTFDPPPTVLYTEIAWSKTLNIGVFSIERILEYPHVVKKDLGGILHKGQVWYRTGTQNNIALHSDLQMIFEGEKPFKISKMRDPILDKATSYYKNQGREATLPLIGRKDSLLAQGYEIATYPGTRREILVGQVGSRYEHILLLKPKKQT